MPAAEIISGTTMGEISKPMIVVLNGKSGLLSPNAARVPRNVEIIVEKKAIMKPKEKKAAKKHKKDEKVLFKHDI